MVDDREMRDFFEFFTEFLDTFSMNRHSAIDIIGHTDNEYLSIFIFYTLGEYFSELFCGDSFP